MSADVRVGVLASGRGSNFAALAAAAANGVLGARITCLVTDNPAAGALAIAARYGIPAHVVDAGARRGRVLATAEAEIIAALRMHGVQLVCLAGFMRILGPELLAAYPDAVLNVHPSLLPAFPGLESQRRAFESGVKLAGCTVHFVDTGVDTGPIVLQAAVAVRDDDTPETLSARILAEEHRLFPAAVRLWADGRLDVRERRVFCRSVPAPAAAAAAHPVTPSGGNS